MLLELLPPAQHTWVAWAGKAMCEALQAFDLWGSCRGAMGR